jgi:hypothetical protein
MHMKSEGWFSDLLLLLQKNWHEPVGFVLGSIFALLLVSQLFAGCARNIGYGVAVALVAIVWFIGWKLPRTKKGKLGFVVCISCEKDEQARQLREDFIETLHALVESGEGGKKLGLIVVPNHRARRVRDTEDALHIGKKTRASFMLYGRARLRSIGEKEVWLLDLNGMVRHAPIPQETGRKFAREFRDLLPSQPRIDRESDALGFEFNSKLVDLEARYIMAIAAALSGSLDYAECLFAEAESRLPQQPMHPVHAKLSARIPRHYAFIRMARASEAYGRWLETHKESDLDLYCKNLSEVPTSERHSVEYTQSQALCLFLTKRDVKAALQLLREHPHGEKPGWHFSVAFLEACGGHLRRAAKHYRSLRFTDVHSEVLKEVEEFFFWLENIEPRNWVVNYCLGLVNWWVKNDVDSAKEELRKFLDKLPPDEQMRERARVERLLNS